jgi:hypothetical protein
MPGFHFGALYPSFIKLATCLQRHALPKLLGKMAAQP